MSKSCNSCVFLKFECCGCPVLKQRQCLTVPSRQRVCHYLSLPNSPLIPLHGYLCSAKPVSSPAALWDMAPVRLEPKGNSLQAATLWKICLLWCVHEIYDFKVLSEVCCDGLWCNRIMEYILCSIPLRGTMAGVHSLRGRAGGWLEVAQHQVQ